MIFQDPMTSLNPVFTIGTQICEVLRHHSGMTRKQARNRAVELLVDLRDAAAIANRTEEFDQRLQDLRERHASKPSFTRRLERAGLAG